MLCMCDVHSMRYVWFQVVYGGTQSAEAVPCAGVPVCLQSGCCLLSAASQLSACCCCAAAALLLLLSGGIFFFSSTVRTACLYSCTVYRFLLGYWLPIISNWDHTSTINAAPHSNVIAYVLRITVSSCRRSCIHFSR